MSNLKLCRNNSQTYRKIKDLDKNKFLIVSHGKPLSIGAFFVLVVLSLLLMEKLLHSFLEN